MQLAAAIGFIAFGVNFFGAILLLLLNAGSRSVRWYLPFQSCVLLWLFSSSVYYLWLTPVFLAIEAFSVAMLPLMFLIFAIMDGSNRPAWHAMVAMLLAAPLLPLVMTGIFMSGLSDVGDVLGLTWTIVGWMGGSFLLFRQGRRDANTLPHKPNVRKRVVLLAFTLIAPLSVLGAMILEGKWFIIFVMPIITIWIMFLIFYGMTQLQFYNVEVRVRRSGDIAAETVELERLAVLGEVAATIAHEVRNPLTGVKSLAQRIATDEISGDKRRQYAEIILEETARVETLVSNLLDLSRRQPKRAQADDLTPLAPLFDDLALLVASRAENKRVQLQTNVPPELTVKAPREVITQAVLNLLLNAIAHAPDGTAVDLKAIRREGKAEIVVRDRGAGIPVAERERIFEPFYSTRAQGTGLGLSVVRHLAREHGWEIAVNDADGGGTEFRLQIT